VEINKRNNAAAMKLNARGVNKAMKSAQAKAQTLGSQEDGAPEYETSVHPNMEGIPFMQVDYLISSLLL
jgi:hypothetical protein